MSRINCWLVAFSVVSSSFSSSNALYDEIYRPQLHHSPPSGWMNDPNGLVYYDNLFHLFYQHNPLKPEFGPIHWGHAISSDLIHWKTLNIALYPSQGNAIYSGNAIIDHDNSTGLQMYDDKPALIAIFTANDMETEEQKQWLAYSNDGPEYEQFKFYKNNPIIPPPSPGKAVDFRDPAIFKHGNHFVNVLVAFDHIKIYNSYDLIEWSLVSEFGKNDGSHAGIWECPSIFPINVTINGVEVEKYILVINMFEAETQYFVGAFDGQTFTNENSKETVLLLDNGPDSYAGNLYNQLPDGRRILINWMSRWDYGNRFNFSVWNGQNGLPRELKLNQIGDQILLSTLPIREIETLRTHPIHKQNITIKKDFVFKLAADDNNQTLKHIVDIEMMLDLTNLKADDQLDIVFFDKNEKVTFYFKDNEFTLDRSKTGRTNFRNFLGPWKAKRHIDSPKLKLRIIIDRSSIEFFADDGLTVMSALFFSHEDIASKMAILVHSSADDSQIHLEELNAYGMKSIWN